MIYPILQIGDPILRRTAVPVSLSINRSYLADLIDNMMETMQENAGVGLAAPQIGISIRCYVVDTLQVHSEGIKRAFINPVILSKSQEMCWMEEGCLSIPGRTAVVERPSSVVVRWLDEDLVERSGEFSGMTARVVQHEQDHLDGVLFTDLLS